MQLIEEFATVTQAPSPEALHAAARRLLGDLEFERYELDLVIDKLDGKDQSWTTLGNIPDGYLPLRAARGCGKRDPVMQHAKKHSWPLYWDCQIYAQRDMMTTYEEQAPWGYGAGFIVAAHLPGNKHVVIGVEREKPLTDSGRQLTHKLALFQLFATCAIDACVAVIGGNEPLTGECPLSGRERDVLGWTLAGKTAWEVSKILGISEGTASQYLSRAARKLDSVNKHQAALKALRLGWIQPPR